MDVMIEVARLGAMPIQANAWVLGAILALVLIGGK